MNNNNKLKIMHVKVAMIVVFCKVDQEFRAAQEELHQPKSTDARIISA